MKTKKTKKKKAKPQTKAKPRPSTLGAYTKVLGR